MFTSGMVEAERDRVEIHGMEPGALKVLVDYCYTGKEYSVKGTILRSAIELFILLGYPQRLD